MLATIKPYVWPKRSSDLAIEPYITRNGDAQLIGREIENDVCRFWLTTNQKPVFITHYLWREGAVKRELSRLDVIQTWSDTLSRIVEVVQVRSCVLAARGFRGPSAYTGFKDEEERLGCEALEEWLTKLRPLHHFFSLFLRELIAVENRSAPPSSWTEDIVPISTRDEILPYVDSAFGIATFPFQVISTLKLMIHDQTLLATFNEFKKQFDVVLPITCTPSPTSHWVTYLRKGGEGPVHYPEPKSASQAKSWMSVLWASDNGVQIEGGGW